MKSEKSAIKRLCKIQSEVSTNYFIKRNGEILIMVPDFHTAWHAGISAWGKYKNLNKNSIGIELVNKGHSFGYKNFKKKQITSLIKVCSSLIKKYNIKKNNVVGHSDVAPFRKKDPGEKFPWSTLARKKIGIWHNCNSMLLKKFRKDRKLKKKDEVDFYKKLKKIGYWFPYKNKKSSVKIIKAFQRHFRKELVNSINTILSSYS